MIPPLLYPPIRLVYPLAFKRTLVRLLLLLLLAMTDFADPKKARRGDHGRDEREPGGGIERGVEAFPDRCGWGVSLRDGRGLRGVVVWCGERGSGEREKGQGESGPEE